MESKIDLRLQSAITTLGRYLSLHIFLNSSLMHCSFVPFEDDAKYSGSSPKRTPSGRGKGVCNWSWTLARMVLISGRLAEV